MKDYDSLTVVRRDHSCGEEILLQLDTEHFVRLRCAVVGMHTQHRAELLTMIRSVDQPCVTWITREG